MRDDQRAAQYSPGTRYPPRRILSFALPSLIGTLNFLTPIEYAGRQTVFIGMLILRSSLPLEFVNLLAIFLLRTLILFPIFLVAGMWLE